MVRFTVQFLPEAEDETLASYEWGLRHWGGELAEKWLRELYEAVFKLLSTFPFSCSIAPESEDARTEIRQLILGRYRVLFEVSGDEVVVLHLSGPYH